MGGFLLEAKAFLTPPAESGVYITLKHTSKHKRAARQTVAALLCRQPSLIPSLQAKHSYSSPACSAGFHIPHLQAGLIIYILFLNSKIIYINKFDYCSIL